ncbi:hypothetical protein [Luteibacter sp. E-22]|uniref:hypothetical protein n=1 Tax=Luteibacter sp. E-22 TaxID=3404050 RepID=UPI003CF50A32
MTDTDDTYVPEPVALADGDVLIPDPVEFAEVTKSIASMVRGNDLFVLCRDTLRWVNVQDIHKQRTGKLSVIKGNNP